MTPTARGRIRATVGLVLAIAPAFPIFQTGRYSTLRGAGLYADRSILTRLLGDLARRGRVLAPA